MHDDKVLTGSLYKTDGELDISEEIEQEAIDFANKIVKFYNPYPIYILDIAKAKDGYSVIEVGSVNMCGFYACNLEIILEKCFEVLEKC